MAGEAIALGPGALVLAQPRGAVVEAALHLHHMRHRVHRPRRARIQRQRAAAGLLGLAVAVVLFQAEGPQRQHMRVQRIVFVPLGQGARRAGAQRGGVAAIEVPQLRPLQRQRVARVLDQQRVPDAAGAGPAAVDDALHGFEVRALAGRGLPGH